MRIGGTSQKPQVEATRHTGKPAAAKPASKVPASAKDLSSLTLREATAHVNKMAKSGSEDFPQIGSGNCGIIAGMVAGKGAQKLVETVRKSLGEIAEPGSPMAELMPKKFDPATQALIAVANSEDEVGVHFSVMDLKTGKIRDLGLVNTVDLSTDEKDGYEVMAGLLKSAKVLKTAESDQGVSGLFPGT